MASIAAKLVRAFFIGLTIGFIGGSGVYLLATAVNALTGEDVVSPVAFFLLVVGTSLVASVGVELSKDLAG